MPTHRFSSTQNSWIAIWCRHDLVASRFSCKASNSCCSCALEGASQPSISPPACDGGKHGPIAEKRASRVFFLAYVACTFIFWCKSHLFLGVRRVQVWGGGGCRLPVEKKLFSEKEKKRENTKKNHKSHPTTAIATEEGEAYSPHKHFGKPHPAWERGVERRGDNRKGM